LRHLRLNSEQRPSICVHLHPSVVHIELLPSPHSPHHFPTTRHSSFNCAALPPLNRPPIPGTADRVRVLMRRAWVGKWCVRAMASDVGDCCRWWVWLLKYIIHVMVKPQRFAEHFCFSLRTSAYSAVTIELIPALIGSFNHPATAAR
jgi:hypothetical protein